MQIYRPLTSPLRPASGSRIRRWSALGAFVCVSGVCAAQPAPETQAGRLTLTELDASAKTGSVSANRAKASGPQQSIVAYSAPIPLPEGVIVGHSPPHWWGSSWDRDRAAWIKGVLWILYGIVGLICIYGIRHYTFTYNRLFGRQRHPYLPIDIADWPRLTVLIPCHNEERVVSSILEALLKVDYPGDRIRIVPVNDRSTDGTRQIIDRFAAAFPDRIIPIHRDGGAPGKAAALEDAVKEVKDDIILVFDADYLPGKDLIKRLAAPFLDPQVGAVMGRVVPVNTPKNLLTRLLDLERAGGYQVDQQARMNLRVIAQYGGTVGGVRVSALQAVGGWRKESLAEDTDITFRLVLGGWKIAYSNRYECYEEVPESWPVRIRQIMRWARGHTDAAIRYMPGLFTRPRLTLRERVDGALLLGTYFMSPILLIGWFLAILAFYLGANPFLGAVAIFSVAAYNTIGNFAAFFEIGAAAHLDGTERRMRILPLVLGGFLVSLVSTSRAVLTQFWPSQGDFKWDKTERYREGAPALSYRTATLGAATAIPAPASSPLQPAPQAHPAPAARPAPVARPITAPRPLSPAADRAPVQPSVPGIPVLPAPVFTASSTPEAPTTATPAALPESRGNFAPQPEHEAPRSERRPLGAADRPAAPSTGQSQPIRNPERRTR